MAEIQRTDSLDSLSDLEATTFVGRIRNGSVTKLVLCRELTWDEVYAIERSVPDPQPPQFASPTGIVHYTEDPDYQKARMEAGRLRLLLKLAEMVQDEGKTRDEKLQSLQRVPAWVINGLTSLLNQMQFAEEAKIEAESRSFRPEDTGASAHPQNNGVVAGALPVTAAG